MKKNIGFIFIFSIISFLTSCELLGLVEKDENGFKDQVLSGKIRNQSFTFVSGIAKEISYYNEWQISLYPTKADEYNSYLSVYPYLVFSIPKDSKPQKYKISTFGNSGLMLTGWASGYDGTWFDDGEIEILSISETEITGRIRGVTNEGTSKINGNFSVKKSI